MRKLLMIVVLGAVVIGITGCVTLEMKLDEDGFSIGLGSEFPEIPSIDYTKVIGE